MYIESYVLHLWSFIEVMVTFNVILWLCLCYAPVNVNPAPSPPSADPRNSEKRLVCLNPLPKDLYS